MTSSRLRSLHPLAKFIHHQVSRLDPDASPSPGHSSMYGRVASVSSQLSICSGHGTPSARRLDACVSAGRPGVSRFVAFTEWCTRRIPSTGVDEGSAQHESLSALLLVSSHVVIWNCAHGVPTRRSLLVLHRCLARAAAWRARVPHARPPKLVLLVRDAARETRPAHVWSAFVGFLRETGDPQDAGA